MLHIFVFVLVCAQFIEAIIIFNPIHHGAKGDGVTYDTEAIRAALAAAEENGGGEVLFDTQHTFLTGCFNVSSNVVLNIKGKILASQRTEDYTKTQLWAWGWSHSLQYQALVQTYYATNVTITGGGVRNVTFTNCSFDGAAHGSGAAIHIKTFRGNGGTVEDVTYSDIRLNNVKIAILFSMRYFADRPPTNDSATTPKVKNIYLDNI